MEKKNNQVKKNNQEKNREEYPTLTLTNQEKEKLGDLAKRNKFAIRDTSFLYSDDNIEVAKNFCNSYRFLDSLYNTLTNKKVANKIKKYMNSIENLYNEIYPIVESFETASMQHTKHLQRKKVSKVVKDNKQTIDYCIDMAFDLGRKIKKMHPGETQGYY